MSQSFADESHGRPENLLARLIAQLSHHALWDSLLIFVPPAVALLYGCVLLVRAACLDQWTALGIALVGFGGAVLAISLRYRPLIPNVATAARLVDQRAGAKDHFLTLATIDVAHSPELLVKRLRWETDELGDRIELTRDFPYQPKRSAYWSLGGSLMVALLLPFFLSIVDPIVHPESIAKRLLGLAEKMSQTVKLKDLSQELKSLVAKLEEPKSQPEKIQVALKEMEKKIEEQQKKEQEKPERDLLGQAQSELKSAEQEQTASGQGAQKDQQQGGGLQSNLPKEGQGESKQSQGGGGNDKGEMNAQLNKEMPQGNSAQGNPKEPGAEKNQRPGEAKGDQPDPNQPGKEQKQTKADKNQGGTKDGAGKNQGSEEPPAGAPPAERFYQAGEGKDGVKNAGYVKVQMPEDVVADAKGESRQTKDAKGGRARSQLPVSNLPLPAHLPNAPIEKQQMPIEYRGIIR